MSYFTDLGGSLLALFATYKYPTLIILLMVEEAGLPLPLPGDLLVMYAGSLFAQGEASASLSILATFLGVVAGSSFLYWLMSRQGRPLLHKYGRYLHLKPERVLQMEGWYRRHGAWVIPFGRLIPGLRIPTTIVSGLAGVPYRTFGPLNALSAAFWSGFYFYLGAILGKEWEKLGQILKIPYWTPIIVVGSIILVTLAAGAITLWRQRRNQTVVPVDESGPQGARQ